jgi:cytochrome c-type biogenesis protein CcmF
MGVHRWIALVGFSVSAFAMLATLAELGHGTRARMARGDGVVRAVATLFRRNRRRYGGYTVHLGVVLLAMGVVGSMVYQVEAEQTLAQGERLAVADYGLTYQGLGSSEEPDKTEVHAQVAVDRDGARMGVLRPTKQVFRLREDQPRTIPAVLHRPLEDVYVLFGAFDPATERVTLKVYVNPLISLVWLGMIVVVAGTIVAAWPDAREARVMNAELVRLMGAGATSAAG